MTPLQMKFALASIIYQREQEKKAIERARRKARRRR
jgi:hypothetical protein